jgi:hypothetical protein
MKPQNHLENIAHIQEELFMDGFIGSKQLCVLLHTPFEHRTWLVIPVVTRWVMTPQDHPASIEVR